MENSKTQFEQKFQEAVEKIKEDQKTATEESKDQVPQYDSFQIEMMHWGVH